VKAPLGRCISRRLNYAVLFVLSVALIANASLSLAGDDTLVYSGQVASMTSQSGAASMVQALSVRGYDAFYRRVDIKGSLWYRVMLGKYSNRSDAIHNLETLKKRKIIGEYFVRQIQAEESVKPEVNQILLQASASGRMASSASESDRQLISEQADLRSENHGPEIKEALQEKKETFRNPSQKASVPDAPDQSAVAEEQQKPEIKNPAPNIEGATPASSAGVQMPTPRTASPQTAGMVTLNFDDADIYSVLQTIFGEVLRVNYIVDPRVKGRVTFRAVTSVPRSGVLQLMEVVLRLNGIGIVEEGGLYRILPISDLSKEPAPIQIGRQLEGIGVTGKSLLQVVPIQYVQSTEIVGMLTPFLSTNAVVVNIPKSNQIIIVDTDANIKRLLQLIDVFDNEKLKQKKPEVFVYAVQNGSAKDIAALLQQIFSKSGQSQTPGKASAVVKGASPAQRYGAAPAPGTLPHAQEGIAGAGSESVVSDLTRIYADEITNSIIIMSTPEDYEIIKQIIGKIDIVPRQVVVEGILAQVTLTDNLSLGMSYLFKANVLKLDTSIGLNTSGLDSTKTTAPGFSMVGIDSSGSVRAMITALAEQSKAKVLASPHVLVADNREAKIQVGQSVPLISSEYYTSASGSQKVYQYRDIGIILKVKPRINDGGLVTIDLSQEISTYTPVSIGAAGETQIALNKMEATSNLVVQDGQTIVIGGLIREDSTKARSGVPFLSRIPLIGWIFGSTGDDKSRVELIILLTPHVVKNQAEAAGLTADYVEGMVESSQGRIQKQELMKKTESTSKTNQPAVPEGP
jgi:general secretion pathway protein D